LPRSPIVYEPGILHSQHKAARPATWDAKKYVIDANHYLVLAVPLPFEGESDSSPAEPLARGEKLP